MRTARARYPGDKLRRSLLRGSHLGWRHADLVLLAVLVILTATFGRPFSKLGWEGSSIFVTELVLLAASALAIARLGVKRSLHMVTSRIPMIPLVVLWIAGAVAVFRGLGDFGASFTVDDVGLVEYSVLLPIVALVVSSTDRLEVLSRALVIGAIGGIVVFGVSDVAARIWGYAGNVVPLQGLASGLYMVLFVVWIASQLVHRQAFKWPHLALGGVAMVLIVLTATRSVWVAWIASLTVIALLAPPGRRLKSAIAVVLAVAAAGFAANVVEEVSGRTLIFAEATGVVHAVAETTGVVQTVPQADGEQADGEQADGEQADGGAGTTAEAANANWRLAVWSELLTRSREAPILGAGFGRPMSFIWMERKYDFRDGLPGTGVDVSGPHNGFIEILYRMGIVGLAATLALIAIAAWRVGPLLRASRLTDVARARLVTVIGIFVAAAALAFFSDALKGPYLAMFFWLPLGLLLVWPTLVDDGLDRSDDAESGVP